MSDLTERIQLTREHRDLILKYGYVSGRLEASNIVEGCARQPQADFVRFLDMAFASVREVEYQLSIAARLGYMPGDLATTLNGKVVETSKVTYGLLKSLRSDS